MINPKMQPQPASKPAVDPNSSRANMATMPAVALSHELIRERAYELYEIRGRQDGHADQDWFRAEQVLLKRG